jgi:Zn finger protein HypA/HybF involved in hydrogenase expression
MPKLQIECTYCGHIWDHHYGYQPDPDYLHCPKCGDKHLKIKEHEKIDYYKEKK